MQDLIQSLSSCVQHSVFVSSRLGEIGPNDLRRYYLRRRWNDNAWMLLESSKLQIRDEHIADFVHKLKLVLADYQQPGTGRVGNGLFLLMGGPSTWAYPTVVEYAKILITGAAKLGAQRVVQLLCEWISGEPLRYRHYALLQGVNIDKPIELPEGIHLSKLPTSSSDLPATLPYYNPTTTVTDYLGGVVLSVDYEMDHALYAPKEGEGQTLDTECRGSVTAAAGKIPGLSFDSFCESMSLACNGYVDWQVIWTDYGELGAFYHCHSGVNYKDRSGTYKTVGCSQERLNKAREIHLMLHANKERKKSLDLAIHRWIRSKRSGSDSDKLIELRIALEALYEIGGLNEKGFRISTYAAWHLGDDFEARRTCSETLRKVYDDSSRAVHAGKLKHTAKDEELVSRGQDFCRMGILKSLEEAEKPNWNELILGMRS